MHGIEILIQDRALIQRATAELTPAQMLPIPPGFDNNTAFFIEAKVRVRPPVPGEYGIGARCRFL